MSDTTDEPRCGWKSLARDASGVRPEMAEALLELLEAIIISAPSRADDAETIYAMATAMLAALSEEGITPLSDTIERAVGEIPVTDPQGAEPDPWDALPAEAKVRMIEVSSEHLTPATLEVLDEEPRRYVGVGALHVGGGDCEHMFGLLGISEAQCAPHGPSDLRDVLLFALRAGAAYLLIGPDRYQHVGLPLYDEEGNERAPTVQGGQS